MTEKLHMPPAFPTPTGQGSCSNNGMSLRDYFAAAALQGIAMLHAIIAEDNLPPAASAAKAAYDMADAMLKARQS